MEPLAFCHYLCGALRKVDADGDSRKVVGATAADEFARAVNKPDAVRICSTPLPMTYSLMLQHSAFWFGLLLPFGLISVTGWATPLFTALVAYSFFGLDALSEELEDPFGTGINDPALDSLCRVSEGSVFEALGEPPPAAVAPNNLHYLKS